MPKDALQTVALGPWDGLLDTKGGSVPPQNKLRNARNMQFSGQLELSVRAGTTVALTLKDDAGTPASVTRVLAVQPFMDGAVAVAHSTATSKVYLYRLPATMDGWYNSAGTLQTTTSPEPCAVLWTSVTAPPDVWLAEGLGTLYVAQTSAIDASGLYFATQAVTFDSAGVPTVATLKANGTGGSVGTDDAYFTTVVSFHQHLCGIGYGAGSTAGYTSFRPELAKFSQPNFGDLQAADSIVIGDRVRALRERAVGLWVAGNALFIGASKYLFRVTGYGRDSWVVETLSEQYGVVGPKAAVAVGDTLYYWTSRGPMRCSDSGTPQPLWDAVVGVVGSVANDATIVAGFDPNTDQVMFLYDTGSGVRTLCAFDTRRGDFCSTDGDIGLVMACAGVVEPIYQSTVTPPSPPAGQTIVSTTEIASEQGTTNWTNTDSLAKSEVSYRKRTDPSYLTAPLQAAGVTSFTITGLSAATAYEWRLRAFKNGVYSGYVGPTTDSQFTTLGGSSGGGGGGGGGTTAPAAPTGLGATAGTAVTLDWTNADSSLPTQILRSTDGVSFAQVGTASAGETSYVDNPTAHGDYYYEVRHVASDGTLGALSDPASVSY